MRHCSDQHSGFDGANSLQLVWFADQNWEWSQDEGDGTIEEKKSACVYHKLWIWWKLILDRLDWVFFFGMLHATAVEGLSILWFSEASDV